jgi:AraC-like DNA-binding protein
MTNAVRSIQTQRLMTISALGLMALMISEPSFAGTGGDAFTDVGISSRSYFYKEFARKFGMTPKDYREQHKNP